MYNLCVGKQKSISAFGVRRSRRPPR